MVVYSDRTTTHWSNIPERLLQVTFLTGTVVTGLSVCAVLTFVITVMVSIYTLVLRGTRSIGPRWSTLGFFGP